MQHTALLRGRNCLPSEPETWQQSSPELQSTWYFGYTTRSRYQPARLLSPAVTPPVGRKNNWSKSAHPKRLSHESSWNCWFHMRHCPLKNYTLENSPRL